MDENTLAEYSWVIITMLIITGFVAFVPGLGDILSEYAKEMIANHF